MKFAVCNEMFGERPWHDICAAVRSHGYDGVEIAPFTLAPTVDQISPAQRRHIRQTAEDHGLEIVGLHWLLAKTEGLSITDRDPKRRRATRDYLCRLVDLCHSLGGRIMVFGSPQQRNLPPDVDKATGLAYAAEVFGEVCLLAEAADVVIALEPLAPSETNFLTSAAEARVLIEMVSHPNLRLHLDAKAMAEEALPMDELVRRNADLLTHVHVNDVNRLGPGMGRLDLRPLLGALVDVGYNGFLSVEIFDMSIGPERVMEESRAYLARQLHNAARTA